jgi:hypothetical protein
VSRDRFPEGAAHAASDPGIDRDDEKEHFHDQA